RYGPPGTPEVLKGIKVTIPKGKVTAIVGHSGSGKSTFLKLLLNFYQPLHGDIKVGARSLMEISPTQWRAACGVVLQDGHLFDDTIERNITESKSRIPIDKESYKRAVAFAMLTDFIEN